MVYVPDIIPAEERARYARGNSPTSHQVNLFDMDMKYADVLPLADVRAHFVHR